MRHLKRKLAMVRARAEVLGQNTAELEELMIGEPTQEPVIQLKETAKALRQQQKSSKLDVNSPTIEEKVEQTASTSDSSYSDTQTFTFERKTFQGSPQSKSKKGSTSAKNIIKNYGRALLNFAISNMSLPYLIPLLEKEKITLKEFRQFFYSKKKQVRSIAGLRNLLLAGPSDDKHVAAFKRVFQALSIIFIKFFSVNWIFSGKLFNKEAHLKCRFKMLRRIQHPENFTYLKGFM